MQNDLPLVFHNCFYVPSSSCSGCLALLWTCLFSSSDIPQFSSSYEIVVYSSPRESNRFSVSVNVEAQKKIKFTLTYEELLNRKLGMYKHFINLEPGQIVDDFSVQINIEESTDITTLSVPAFNTGEPLSLSTLTQTFQDVGFWEINNFNANTRGIFKNVSDADTINTLATILRPTPHSAVVKFAPTPDEQRKLSNDGIKGQLVVLYDVDRSSFPSQILVSKPHTTSLCINQLWPLYTTLLFFSGQWWLFCSLLCTWSSEAIAKICNVCVGC